MAAPRTLDELYRKQEIGEFMTGPGPGLTGWSDRRKSDLIGTFKSTHAVPQFRPFDLLTAPNQPLVILENDSHRIGVEAVHGVQDAFHRYIDADMIYFQFCGSTTLETEFGVFEMAPGEVVLVPGGIAHRSTGTADSLRYFCQSYDPMDYVMDEDQYTSETSFTMRRQGGPTWQISSERQQASAGRVLERMHRWDDGPNDLTEGERDYEGLVGVTKLRGPHPGGVRKRRAFDHFTGVAGKSGGGGDGAPGTQYLMTGPHLKVRCYNIVGEQFAFHRGLRSEELHVQFRGDAIDVCEFGEFAKEPGEVTVIPRGIAHSVITDPPEDETFLRLNFYSDLPWRVPIDPTVHAFESRFECETAVLKEADWKSSAAR
jgi:quercetin dioxygenase-like cupin family protein